MKKFITLLLVLTGMVSTASAAKLYIENADPTNWTDIDVYAWEEAETVTNHNEWGTDHDALSTVELYGTTWYVFEMTNNWNRAIVRGQSANWNNVKTSNLVVENDLYITVGGSQGNVYVYQRNYSYPVFRGDLDNNWDSNIENAEKKDAFTFYKEYDKSTIDSWATANSRTDFCFRFKAGYSTVASFWPQIYPDAVNTSLGIGATLLNAYENTDNTYNCWQVTIPSYSYDKIRLTAAYRKVNGNWKWQISADAYFSKSITAANEYATFGTTVPVDLSKLPENVTAYTVTADASTGRITKTVKSNALAANEGVLLQNATGGDVNLSIPVASSAVASASNDMVAFTGSSSDKVTPASTDGTNNYTHYILAKEDAGVGFYKVNAAGNNMGANTAYLKVVDPETPEPGSPARSYLWFDDASGVDATLVNGEERIVNNVYDLQGRKVNAMKKGLYIVNGKKVIKN